MQKPLVNNRFLYKKWRVQETEELTKKIRATKSEVKLECPESFNFRKKHFPSHTLDGREAEIRRRNKILVEKICYIYDKKPKTIFNEKEERENHIKSLNGKSRKQTIQRISNENFELSKRIVEQKPCYDRKKWESDFGLSNYYMKNICEFPSQQFEKRSFMDNTDPAATTTANLSQLSSNMRSMSMSTGFLKNVKLISNEHDSNRYFQKPIEEYVSHMEDDYGVKTTLYSKKIYLEDLDECYCKIYIENKKLIISVQSLLSRINDTHFMIFDDYEEVWRLCRGYKSFTDIVNNIEYKDNAIQLRYANEKFNYRTNKIEIEMRYRQPEKTDVSFKNKRATTEKQTEKDQTQTEQDQTQTEKDQNQTEKDQSQTFEPEMERKEHRVDSLVIESSKQDTKEDNMSKYKVQDTKEENMSKYKEESSYPNDKVSSSKADKSSFGGKNDTKDEYKSENTFKESDIKQTSQRNDEQYKEEFNELVNQIDNTKYEEKDSSSREKHKETEGDKVTNKLIEENEVDDQVDLHEDIMENDRKDEDVIEDNEEKSKSGKSSSSENRDDEIINDDDDDDDNDDDDDKSESPSVIHQQEISGYHGKNSPVEVGSNEANSLIKDPIVDDDDIYDQESKIQHTLSREEQILEDQIHKQNNKSLGDIDVLEPNEDRIMEQNDLSNNNDEVVENKEEEWIEQKEEKVDDQIDDVYELKNDDKSQDEIKEENLVDKIVEKHKHEKIDQFKSRTNIAIDIVDEDMILEIPSDQSPSDNIKSNKSNKSNKPDSDSPNEPALHTQQTDIQEEFAEKFSKLNKLENFQDISEREDDYLENKFD